MGQRGFSFHPALSSQPLFSEKKPTPWLAVSKTTAFWGNAAPLYPWTSWAGGKMSSSPCVETALCSIVLYYNPGKLGWGFLLQCWLMTLFGSHGGRLIGICRDLACAMCLRCTPGPWHSHPPVQCPAVSVACRGGVCPLQRGVHDLHVGEQRDTHSQLLSLLPVGAPAPWPVLQEDVQWWVLAQGGYCQHCWSWHQAAPLP